MDRWILLLRGLLALAIVIYACFQVSQVFRSYSSPLTSVSTEKLGYAPPANIVICPVAVTGPLRIGCGITGDNAVVNAYNNPSFTNSCLGRLSRLENRYSFINYAGNYTDCVLMNGRGLKLGLTELVTVMLTYNASLPSNPIYFFTVIPTSDIDAAAEPLLPTGPGADDLLYFSSVHDLPHADADRVVRGPIMLGDLSGAVSLTYRMSKYVPISMFGSPEPTYGVSFTITNVGPFPRGSGWAQAPLAASAASEDITVTTEIPQTSVTDAFSAIGGFISLSGGIVAFLVGRGEYKREGLVHVWVDKHEKRKGRRRRRGEDLRTPLVEAEERPNVAMVALAEQDKAQIERVGGTPRE